MIVPGSPLTSSGRKAGGSSKLTSLRKVLKTTFTVPVATKPPVLGSPMPPPAPTSMLPATPKPFGPAFATSSAVAWA